MLALQLTVSDLFECAVHHFKYTVDGSALNVCAHLQVAILLYTDGPVYPW